MLTWLSLAFHSNSERGYLKLMKTKLSSLLVKEINISPIPTEEKEAMLDDMEVSISEMDRDPYEVVDAKVFD